MPGRAAGRRRRAVRLRVAVVVGPALVERAQRLQAAHAGDARATCTRACCGPPSVCRSPRAACAGSTSAGCTRRTWRRCRTRCGAWASRAASACRTASRCPPTGFEQRHVVGGDATSAAIAAASVIAKVTRDRFMQRMEKQYPGWEFGAHVGYSTPEHRAAIEKLGVSPLHRMSFQSMAYQQLALYLDDGTFVLVHGAWHGGWCWRDVAVELCVRRATTCSRRPRRASPSARGLAASRRSVAPRRGARGAAVLRRPARGRRSSAIPTAALVITGAAARAHARISRLVFLDAFVAEDGQSMFDLLRPGAAQGLRGVDVRRADRRAAVA